MGRLELVGPWKRVAAPAERASIRDTLAWALFANGRFDEAVAEEEQALEEAASNRGQIEGYLARLKEKIEEEIDPRNEAEREQHVAALEKTIAALEAEISTRPEWNFADGQDRWWHNQLEKLVEGLMSFSDSSTGIEGSGTSAEHGRGISKRAEFAAAISDRSVRGPEAVAKWTEATSSIANALACPAYAGLRIAPQLGLLPIGRDPGSGLWEFAHLQSGEPAERGPDGRLVLEEATGLVFVLLPGGTFTMGAGSDPAGPNYDPQAIPDETAHEVTLSPFFLSKYEMTQGQWLRFVGQNPSQYSPQGRYATDWNRTGRKTDLAYPVEFVSWNECTKVLGRLELELPSQAQWEYGARAGTSTVWWTGNEKQALAEAGNVVDSYAKSHGGQAWSNHELDLDDGRTLHARVGSYRANAFGLHDVIGNVSEWCRDGYRHDFYRQGSQKDPVSDPAGSSARLNRGGSFMAPASVARSAVRFNASPSLAYITLGVRPARPISH